MGGRGAARGGLAATLNELAAQSGVGMHLREAAILVRPEVAAACELLGLDPLYLANEGTLVLFVPEAEAEAALLAMRARPEGQGAAIIGRAVADHAGQVRMITPFGGQRIVDMLVGDQLPRIC